jgi:hypothetical protein
MPFRATVMAGLVPAIHALLFLLGTRLRRYRQKKTWMAGTSPAMTVV